jgi:hypothetical protein
LFIEQTTDYRIVRQDNGSMNAIWYSRLKEWNELRFFGVILRREMSYPIWMGVGEKY